MADVLHGLTQWAAFFDTVFGPMMLGYYEKDKALLNYCTDYSAFLTPGSKAVTLPQLATRTVASYTTQSTDLDYAGSGSVEVAKTITVNQMKAEVFLFEDLATLQTQPATIPTYAAQSASLLRDALVNYVVDSIITSATGNDIAIVNGGDNIITWAKVTEALGALLTDDVRTSECALGLSGTAWGASVSDWGDKYMNAAYRGTPGFASNGETGTLAGMPVFVSSHWSAAGTTGVECGSIWHPTAIGYAIQGGIRVKQGTNLRQGLADELGIGLHFGATLLMDSGVANFTAATD